MRLMLPPQARPIQGSILDSSKPEDILYEAEEPVVFTLQTVFDQQLIAYVADETAGSRWLLLAPCSSTTIESLRAGRLAVRDALVGSWLWLAELGQDGRWSGLWSVDAADIPDDHLPRPGTLLHPDLEPVLSARVIGEGIARATIPASVIAYAADAVRKSIKALLEYVVDPESYARLPVSLRELYDLPAQRLAFNSFEISFSAPSHLKPSEEYRVQHLLRKGLSWASATDNEPLLGDSDAERHALLKSILELTPPSRGPIERVELGGRWLPEKAALLTRASRARIRSEMKRLQVEKVITVKGRIGELDRDKYSLTLREVPGRGEMTCLFGDETFDDALDAFNSGERVTLVGAERSGKLHVKAISGAGQEAAR